MFLGHRLAWETYLKELSMMYSRHCAQKAIETGFTHSLGAWQW